MATFLPYSHVARDAARKTADRQERAALSKDTDQEVEKPVCHEVGPGSKPHQCKSYCNNLTAHCCQRCDI